MPGVAHRRMELLWALSPNCSILGRHGQHWRLHHSTDAASGQWTSRQPSGSPVEGGTCPSTCHLPEGPSPGASQPPPSTGSFLLSPFLPVLAPSLPLLFPLYPVHHLSVPPSTPPRQALVLCSCRQSDWRAFFSTASPSPDWTSIAPDRSTASHTKPNRVDTYSAESRTRHSTISRITPTNLEYRVSSLFATVARRPPSWLRREHLAPVQPYPNARPTRACTSNCPR